jgi:hypothetical protein
VDQPPITTSLTYLLAQANRVVTATLERLLAQEGDDRALARARGLV